MEKDHRLFLRNLPPDIDNDKLQKLFEEHGTVNDIDIKNKIQNDGSRIAFVNLIITDGRLNTCFRTVNGRVLSGNTIRVEVAKESFLERLKREREEAVNRTDTSKEPKKCHDHPIEKININAPTNIKTKPTKKIYNFDELDNNDLAQVEVGQSNDTSTFTYDSALHVETIPIKKPLKIERQIPEESKPKVEKIPEKKILTQSEIKRLASVKQKRQAFKAKEQMISYSLKAVDNSSSNKKVLFSDEIDKIGNSEEKRSKSLFDDDEDGEDQADWNADKFRHDEKRSAKLTMSLNNLGRDKRFALDERFLDDEEDISKVKVTEENDENDLKNEAKWQLGILQNVLGKPFRAREENLNAKKQNKMVRYDPTASGHRDHELEMTQRPVKAKKRKLATNEAEPKEEAAPIVVSSDVFYSVSENLTESLKVQGEFSLLKTFGTPTLTDKNRSDDYSATSNSAQGQTWDAKNPFKYESSDDEGPEPSMDQLTSNNDASSRQKSNDHLSATKETFFYDVNDELFRDVEEFFKTRPSTTGNFPSIRRELKLIVRSKVRNNVKKSTPWRNKKIGAKPKTR